MVIKNMKLFQKILIDIWYVQQYIKNNKIDISFSNSKNKVNNSVQLYLTSNPATNK